MTRRARGVTAILLGGIAVLFAGAAVAADAVLPAAGLRADAAILRDAFETLHPGLHRYLTPAKVDAAFRELDDAFAKDRTTGEAFRAFTALTAKLRCGHTWPSFYNQPAAVERALFDPPRVPFTFRWVDQRMLVTRSYAGDPRLAPGCEVLSLDGRAASLVLVDLMKLARADGGNDAKRVSQLEVTGGDREAFDIYYALSFARRDSLDLVIRAPGSRVKQALRVAWTAKRPGAAAAKPAKGAPLWTFAWRGESTAVLTMPTWVTYNSTWDWKAWLGARLGEVVARRGASLIVDLRGNEGGTDDVGLELMRLLVARPVRVEMNEKRVRYRKVPDRLRPHLNTWDDSFYDWGNAVTEAGDGLYRWIQRGAADRTITPAGEGIGGRVIVLVGAANSSATFAFADVVKRNGLATLVGQPTGGNLQGTNGGGMFFLTLPNSKIEVDVPIFGYFPLFPRGEGGVTPDVLVKPTPAGIASSADEEMAAALAELARK